MPCIQLSYSPMSDIHLVLMIPLGRRWKSYSVPSTTTVWPALFPPCKKTQTWLSYPYNINVHYTLWILAGWLPKTTIYILVSIWKFYADPYLPFLRPETGQMGKDRNQSTCPGPIFWTAMAKRLTSRLKLSLTWPSHMSKLACECNPASLVKGCTQACEWHLVRLWTSLLQSSRLESLLSKRS